MIQWLDLINLYFCNKSTFQYTYLQMLSVKTTNYIYFTITTDLTDMFGIPGK